MRFGTLELKSCNDCPAFKHGGYTWANHDRGYQCEFGAFSGFDSGTQPADGLKQIPPSCPIRKLRDQLKPAPVAQSEQSQEGEQ